MSVSSCFNNLNYRYISNGDISNINSSDRKNGNIIVIVILIRIVVVVVVAMVIIVTVVSA